MVEPISGDALTYPMLLPVYLSEPAVLIELFRYVPPTSAAHNALVAAVGYLDNPLDAPGMPQYRLDVCGKELEVLQYPSGNWSTVDRAPGICLDEYLTEEDKAGIVDAAVTGAVLFISGAPTAAIGYVGSKALSITTGILWRKLNADTWEAVGTLSRPKDDLLVGDGPPPLQIDLEAITIDPGFTG